MIDQIWDTYDEDGSGNLDKEETKKFVMDTLGQLGKADNFTDEDFEKIFSQIDDDGSGLLGKDEMVALVSQLTGANKQLTDEDIR